MFDLLLSIVLWSVLLIGAVACTKFLGLGKLSLRKLVVVVAVFAGYIFLVKSEFAFVGALNFSEAALKLNMDGKLFGSLFTIAAAIALVRTKISGSALATSMGFVWNQNKGSIGPSVIVVVLFMLLVALVDHFIGKSSVPVLDSMTVFYPVIAGLDEELMYRGVLLALLCSLAPSILFTIKGAPISLGGMIALLLFALIHGLKIKHGMLQISPPGMVLTFIYGGVYLWLRERTGSLLMPVVAHNLGNTVAWLL